MSMLTTLLASPLPLPPGGEAQLLPAGTFSARDGRPNDVRAWRLDDAAGHLLASRINAVASVTPIVIDYEHQTINAEKNGQAAPAAGWINAVEWRDGQGLFASVEWTARAKGLIAAGEYRYISPVISYDRNSGLVHGLHNAALVNHPALLGMQVVKASAEAAECALKGSSELLSEANVLAQRIRAQQAGAALEGHFISTAAAACKLTEYGTAKLAGEERAQQRASRDGTTKEARRIADAAIAHQVAHPSLSIAQAVRAVTTP